VYPANEKLMSAEDRCEIRDVAGHGKGMGIRELGLRKKGETAFSHDLPIRFPLWGSKATFLIP
jgi:hypothetical protein